MTDNEVLAHQVVILQSRIDLITEQYKRERAEDGRVGTWQAQRLRTFENALTHAVVILRAVAREFNCEPEIGKITDEMMRAYYYQGDAKEQGFMYYPPCSKESCPLAERSFDPAAAKFEKEEKR